MSPEFNTAADAMMDTAPVDWWRFVGCRTCNAQGGEPCRMGGDSWPKPAHRPHQGRYRAGLMLHAVFWLLDNPADGGIKAAGEEISAALDADVLRDRLAAVDRTPDTDPPADTGPLWDAIAAVGRVEALLAPQWRNSLTYDRNALIDDLRDALDAAPETAAGDAWRGTAGTTEAMGGRSEPCSEFGCHPIGGHAAAVRERAEREAALRAIAPDQYSAEDF